mgnify:CR=1 FL=1
MRTGPSAGIVCGNGWPIKYCKRSAPHASAAGGWCDEGGPELGGPDLGGPELGGPEFGGCVPCMFGGDVAGGLARSVAAGEGVI